MKDLLAAAANENDKSEKCAAFENNVPFRSCISKINNTLIDNIEVIIYWNIVTIIIWRQGFCGICIETKLMCWC